MSAQTRSCEGMASRILSVAARMRAEDAIDLSDAEIERTLKDCVCGKKLIPLAKAWRDAGLLTLGAA